MSTRFYDTDLTDAAWAWVAPVLAAARPRGRPRTTDLRSVLNAIFYLLRTGCQWRLLPREFPPWGTVYHYFQAWQNCGVCGFIYTARSTSSRDAGRAACPSVVILDGPIGQDYRAWWCSWFWHVQANKGPQTSHFSRYAWATGCQPCRTGRHIRSACVRSAAWRQLCLAGEEPPTEQGLRILSANLRDDDRPRRNPPLCSTGSRLDKTFQTSSYEPSTVEAFAGS
jgi:transposase